MVLTAAALFGTAASVLVISDSSTSRSAIAQAFAAPQLSDVELQSRLQAQGYTNVQSLKHDGGNLVTVTASKDGQTAQLIVDGATGQVGLSDDDDGDD